MLGFYARNPKAVCLLAVLVVVGFMAGVYQFLGYYFLQQPSLVQTEMVSMTPAKEVFSYTESVRDDYRIIYFTPNFDTTMWDNSNMTFEGYRVFHTKRLEDSKYVFGNISSYTPGDGNLYLARDFELANATPIRVFLYSNGDVAYKAVA